MEIFRRKKNLKNSYLKCLKIYFFRNNKIKWLPRRVTVPSPCVDTILSKYKWLNSTKARKCWWKVGGLNYLWQVSISTYCCHALKNCPMLGFKKYFLHEGHMFNKFWLWEGRGYFAPPELFFANCKLQEGEVKKKKLFKKIDC